MAKARSKPKGSTTKIIRYGDDFVVPIPVRFVRAAGMSPNDEVELHVEPGLIRLSRPGTADEVIVLQSRHPNDAP